VSPKPAAASIMHSECTTVIHFHLGQVYYKHPTCVKFWIPGLASSTRVWRRVKSPWKASLPRRFLQLLRSSCVAQRPDCSKLLRTVRPSQLPRRLNLCNRGPAASRAAKTMRAFGGLKAASFMLTSSGWRVCDTICGMDGQSDDKVAMEVGTLQVGLT
jgi:hypothetical protein